MHKHTNHHKTKHSTLIFNQKRTSFTTYTQTSRMSSTR